MTAQPPHRIHGNDLFAYICYKNQAFNFGYICQSHGSVMGIFNTDWWKGLLVSHDPGIRLGVTYRCATVQTTRVNWSTGHCPNEAEPTWSCLRDEEKPRHNGKLRFASGLPQTNSMHTWQASFKRQAFGHFEFSASHFFWGWWLEFYRFCRIHLGGGTKGFLGKHPSWVRRSVTPIDFSHGVQPFGRATSNWQPDPERGQTWTNYGPTKSTETSSGMIQVEIQIPDGFFWVK